jgi:hypothetical protein
VLQNFCGLDLRYNTSRQDEFQPDFRFIEFFENQAALVDEVILAFCSSGFPAQVLELRPQASRVKYT